MPPKPSSESEPYVPPHKRTGAATGGSDATDGSPLDPRRTPSVRPSEVATSANEVVFHPIILRALENKGWICDYQMAYNREVDLAADGGQQLLERLPPDFLEIFGEASVYPQKRGDKVAGIRTGKFEIDFVAPIYQRADTGTMAEFFPQRERSPPNNGIVAIFELTHTNDFTYKLLQLERNVQAYELYREKKKRPVTVQFAGIATRYVPEYASRILANAKMQRAMPRLHALNQAGRLMFLKLNDFETDDSDAPIWVRYFVGGVQVGRPFLVEPAKPRNVDRLADAVKAKMQLLQPAPLLVVKDKDGNVLESDAEVVANAKDTAYIVE